MIKILLKHGTRIPFTTTMTGESGFLTSTHGSMCLSKGRIYRIPVNTTETTDENNVFKPLGMVNELIDIRNIRNGFAMIVPIIHNTKIVDGMELGVFL